MIKRVESTTFLGLENNINDFIVSAKAHVLGMHITKDVQFNNWYADISYSPIPGVQNCSIPVTSNLNSLEEYKLAYETKVADLETATTALEAKTADLDAILTAVQLKDETVTDQAGILAYIADSTPGGV